MSGHVITETATFDASVTVPDNGDPEFAESVSAPGVGFQPLANRTQWLKQSMLNYVWKGERPTMQSLTTTQFNIGAVQGLLIGGESLPAHATINLTSPSAAFPAMANNTWYYVYAYASGGAIAYLVSTTVPDDSLTTMFDDGTKRYVGAFRSDASSHILGFRMVRGRYVYRYGIMPGSIGTEYLMSLPPTHHDTTPMLFNLKDNGGAQTLLPPHANMASIRAKLTSSAVGFASIGRSGDGIGVGTGFNMETPSAGFTYENFEIQALGPQLEFITDGNVNTLLTVWMLGWSE